MSRINIIKATIQDHTPSHLTSGEISSGHCDVRIDDHNGLNDDGSLNDQASWTEFVIAEHYQKNFGKNFMSKTITFALDNIQRQNFIVELAKNNLDELIPWLAGAANDDQWDLLLTLRRQEQKKQMDVVYKNHANRQ